MNIENMNKATEPTATLAEATGGQKTFSQDQVNAIVQERLARDREKQSEELDKREQELLQREFQLNSRQKLIERGYPESLFEALNNSNEEAFNKALDIIDGLMEERMSRKKEEEKQARLEAGRAKPFTGPLKSSHWTKADPIREAMRL